MQMDIVENDDIEQLLHSSNFYDVFPPGSVWRVHIEMFHAHLRSFYLGRLVAERYGHIQFAGAIISSALKFIAHKEYAFTKTNLPQNEESRHYFEDKTIFTPADIIPFLPSAVLTALSNLPGGIQTNLSATLVQISKLTNPSAIFEVEEAQGHADGGRFEVSTKDLLNYLRGRLLHQSIRDHHGDVPARICSILESKGHLEGEAIAESAMVPAKDAREMLHRLYKTNYISLLYLQNAKQHNPANAIYLWCVDKKRIQRTVLLNMCTALCNLRQRRQHEVQIGKDWIERAKLADGDENDVEMDKINYKKFCQGLERIDNACIQLDETIMVIKDF
jgi:DNA-directed RNA polymerase III subunit RPC3